MTALTSTTHGYTPRIESLAARVCGFFVLNPDEELTVGDIAEKFGAHGMSNVHTQLRPALDALLLLRHRNDDGEYLYKRGASLPALNSNADDATATTATTPPVIASAARQSMPKRNRPPVAPTTGSRKAELEITPAMLASLKVEDGVRLMPRMGEAGADKWAPLFAKLTKPGQSVALPAAWHGPVGAACVKRNKSGKDGNKSGATWRVRKISATESRLWRVA